MVVLGNDGCREDVYMPSVVFQLVYELGLSQCLRQKEHQERYGNEQ